MSRFPEETMMNWTSLQNSMTGTKKRAMRALMAEYTSLLREPAEGFVVKVDDPFNWDVGIYGPPSTPYWGGYFKVHVTFPDEYPFEPPKLKFKSRFWHPNVYHNGSVCMSILHDPDAEVIPTDLPREEKWNPSLSVRTVLLSLISIMGSPNPDSPANPEASKMYRSWLEEGDQDYVRVIEEIVRRSKKTASKDGVTVPKTLEEYLTIPKPKTNEPLVAYSSDEDDSDHSELLSLPSSQESDQEQVFDVEPSWVTINSISADRSNPALLGQNNSSSSILSYQRNSIGKASSSPIADSLAPRSPLTEEYKDGTSSNNPFRISVSADSSNTSRAVSQSVDTCQVSNSTISPMSPISTIPLIDSSRSEHIVTSSKDDDNTSVDASLARGNDLISSSDESSRDIEETEQSEVAPSQIDRSYATSSLNDNGLCNREPVESSSNNNTSSNPSSSLSGRMASTARPANCIRKRRRPPRLYIYSQLNDIKKRKRH